MATALAHTPAVFEELAPPLKEEEAALEADRCLECGGPYAPAPCVVACPADVDVPSFVAAIAKDDPATAAGTIFAENLLGGTCSRVCPVEMMCEGACVLQHEGRRPVKIARLQRYATDWAFAHNLALRRRATPTGRRVAVIGAGPAGLACAGELAARGHHVTVVDAHEEVGGLARYAIAPYRQLRDPLPKEARALADLGVEFQLHAAIDGPDALHAVEAEADAVFLGIGMGKDVEFDCLGQDLPGVWDSLPFIEALKTGTPPAVGDQVAVVGGGNTAIDIAREAVRLGAGDVTVLYRRTQSEMPAYPQEVVEAREEGVHFQWLTVPTRFVGHQRLEGVRCCYMRLGEPDGSGRPRPERVPGTEFTLPADTAVKAIGQQPRIDLLSLVEDLELENGLVKIDPGTGRTSNPKYFAAGDATNGGGTVVEAVRGAKVAARSIDAALKERVR